jgi:hypothetical protein
MRVVTVPREQPHHGLRVLCCGVYGHLADSSPQLGQNAAFQNVSAHQGRLNSELKCSETAAMFVVSPRVQGLEHANPRLNDGNGRSVTGLPAARE